MNSDLFLKSIFEGYVHCMRKLNWGPKGTYSDWTAGDFVHFKELGESLGFQGVQEYKNIDLTWISEDGSVFMYLERETHNDNTLRTMEKLLEESIAYKPKFIIGVFGWVTKDRYDQIIVEVESKNNGRDILIIASIGDSKENATDLHGAVFSGGFSWERKAIMDTDNANYWYGYFDSTSKWV